MLSAFTHPSPLFIQVNDEAVTLPFLREPYIYIERQTNTILLNTNIGLKVQYSLFFCLFTFSQIWSLPVL